MLNKLTLDICITDYIQVKFNHLALSQSISRQSTIKSVLLCVTDKNNIV